MLKSTPAPNKRGQWNSKLGFILAATGSAIGLGNIWRFSYVTGENGGGAFVLIYIICILLVGLPIIISEFMIGRSTQKDPIASFKKIRGKKTPFQLIGIMGVIAAFIILSWYAVIAGWTIHYSIKSFQISFSQENLSQSLIQDIKTTKTKDEWKKKLENPYKAFMVENFEKEKQNKKDEIKFNRDENGNVLLGTGENILLDEISKISYPYMKSIDPSKENINQDIDKIVSNLKEHLNKTNIKIELYKTIKDKNDKQKKKKISVYFDSGTSFEKINEIELKQRIKDMFFHVQIANYENDLMENEPLQAIYLIIVMLLTIIVVFFGVARGIEMAAKILMPLLFAIIIYLIGHAIFTGAITEALSYLFQPDFSKIQTKTIFQALGQAFFTLSLGMGTMLTYGSYLSKKEKLASAGITVCFFDTLIAVLSGIIIFSIIFANNADPAGGPTLIFKTLPLLFSKMAGGSIISILFFLLLFFAAFTSVVSLLEVPVASAIENLKMSRKKAVIIAGILITILGLPSAFSSSTISDFIVVGKDSIWFHFFGAEKLSFLGFFEWLAANFMLPLGGMFIAIFTGWFVTKKFLKEQLFGFGKYLIPIWKPLVGIIVPILVFLVFLNTMGIIKIILE